MEKESNQNRIGKINKSHKNYGICFRVKGFLEYIENNRRKKNIFLEYRICKLAKFNLAQ